MTRRRSQALNVDGRLPVREYSEQQLRTILVEDAVRHHATELAWAIAAYTRIGKLSHKGAEQAFLGVVAEVEALTGLPEMPVTSVSDAELRRMLT